MSCLASTSALRCFPRIANAPRRYLTSASYRRQASYDGSRDNATPARAHREGTDVSRGAGGPDLDPMSGEARNSATQSSQSSANISANMLSMVAQRLEDRSLANRNAQETSSPAAPTSTPTTYSKELLPLKVDPTLEAFVGNLMRDGKKASATRHVLEMMEYLSQALHADPLPALQSAIRAAGPLVRMQSRKNGGKVTPVPIALGPDQSRRRGIMAIIEASKKRSDKKVSIRLAREVVAVIEGNSSTLARKEEIHRFAMVNRSNINSRM